MLHTTALSEILKVDTEGVQDAQGGNENMGKCWSRLKFGFLKLLNACFIGFLFIN